MTQQKKNDNTTGSTGTQSNVGSQKGQQNQGQQGQKGAQAGGKNPPVGGPETFESDQTNQGKGTTPAGQQSGRDPYPPVNPDRPMMAGGQQGGTQGKPSGGQNLQGSKPQGSNIGGTPQGGQSYGGSAGKPSSQGGNFGASQGGITGQTGAAGVGTSPGLEEEE